jgi:hypothetical protein
MIRVVHPGSPIPDPDADFLPIPDPGSRGKKGTGSRIRIHNTGLPGFRGLKMWAVFTEHHPPLRPSTQSKTSNLKEEEKMVFFPFIFLV